MKIQLLLAFLFVIAPALSNPALASPIDALRLRAAIEVTNPQPFHLNLFHAPTETLELPVSRGFNQLDTQLCWTYALFNALETRYKVKHPSSATLELSRGTMQLLTMRDRFLRKIQNGEDYLSERGDVVDAYHLVMKHGLYAYPDYQDILNTSESYYPGVKQTVFSQGIQSEQEKALTSELAKIFPALPEHSTFLRGKVTPLEMGEGVLGGEQWMEYAAIDDDVDHETGWADHPDPDARVESKAYYLSREQMINKANESLRNGIPVTFSTRAHAVLIYGAKFDTQGNAIEYKIKDSYPDYFYNANARAVYHQVMSFGTTLTPQSLP